MPPTRQQPQLTVKLQHGDESRIVKVVEVPSYAMLMNLCRIKYPERESRVISAAGGAAPESPPRLQPAAASRADKVPVLRLP